MTSKRRLRAVALVGAAALVFAACGGDDGAEEDPTSEETTGAAETEAPTESEMASEMPSETAAASETTGGEGVLQGVRGTLPSADITQDFRDRLLEVDPELTDYSYSGETYDAVIILALAAEVAGTDDPLAMASEINGVTKDGDVCTSFEECKTMIADGADIDYDGVGGPYAFSAAGEPTSASFAILQYGADNQIDDSLTEFRQAEISEDALPTDVATPEASGGDSDGQLHVGTLLPETGDLAFLGPPEFAGAQLAANDVNDAGGVLDQEMLLTQGDSGDTNTDIANQTVDEHLAAGVDAIVGAASSGVSFTVIDKITAANKIHFSPANTAPDFTTYADNGLYFRTAPSDVLQGRVLADSILADGGSNVVIFTRQDPYGEGLLEYTQTPLEEAGATVTPIVYDPAATEFAAEVQEAVAASPDTIALIGFAESEQVIKTMIEQGIGPQEIPLWLVDGNIGNALGEKFNE
ncbi:ABC transporter substrate-binding protein [Salsipaludibacter albus]|uniref:ABC transporter substrate-binding protein n=1 Tax=Salsipaludibacter albus TaxID=2849650 RepID=UPI001EE49225|nr:ABC transporter substrate-binding protein [Salsipaludibacter albus]MBY5162705.1 ABC transporter substrate-binding protein [Salsipaludibacter albus]